MNKRKVIPMALAAFLAVSAGSFSVSADQGLTEAVSLNPASGMPEFISGSLTYASEEQPLEIVLSYLESEESVYQNIDAEDFQVITEETDELGFTNIKLQQLHQGIPVYGSVLAAHIREDGVLTSISGELVQDLPEINEQNIAGLLNPEKASALILADLEGKLKTVPEINQNESPTLVFYEGNGEAKLAYSSRIEFLSPEPGNYSYMIDAENGTVLASANQIHTADPEGENSRTRGKGVLGDIKKLNTVKNKGGTFLLDRTRGKGIATYDAKNMLTIPGTLWLDTDHKLNSTYDRAAVDAHAYAGQTFDYYHKVHKRSSYDGKGARVISTVHYGEAYNNAFWSGSQMVYGDGDGILFTSLSGSLDVVAHELTHAVTQTTAQLIYQGDSGALNESMSDIFGAIIEGHYSKRPDWLIGEDIYTPKQAGDALRSLSDPTANGLPDHYTKRYLGTDDFGGVHINSSITNKAAYLLANGGTHYKVKVNGIGTAKTGKILYRTLTQYLTPNATFRQYRAAAIEAATDLYGHDSREAASVKASFSAVGLK